MEDVMSDAAPADAPETSETVASEPSASGDRTFTQDDLDKIVETRLAKERRKYGDYDQLQAKAARFDELEAANKTELEKAHERAARAEAQAAEATATANQRLMQSAVMAEAVKAGAVDPDAVWRLLDSDAVTVTGDTVDGVTDAVAALLEARPYLVRGETAAAAVPQAGSPANPAKPSPSGTPTFTRAQLQDHRFWQEHKAEIERAIAEGRITD